MSELSSEALGSPGRRVGVIALFQNTSSFNLSSFLFSTPSYPTIPKQHLPICFQISPTSTWGDVSISVLTINYFCEALPHNSFYLCFQAFRMAKGKPVLQGKRWINNTLGLNQGALEDVSQMLTCSIKKALDRPGIWPVAFQSKGIKSQSGISVPPTKSTKYMWAGFRAANATGMHGDISHFEWS